MSELADALLEAHVQHELARWHGEAAAHSIAIQVGALFRWLDEVTLGQVATPAQIIALLERQVIDRPVGDGLTELVAEFSQLVLTSRHSATTRLDQVLADDEYEEFAGKVTALEGVGRRLITIIARSEAFALFRSRVIVRAFSALAFPRGRLRAVTGGVLASVERRVAHALAQWLESHRMSPGQAERELLDLIDREWLHSAVDEIWAAVAPLPLAETFAMLGEQDIEDFVVLGYGVWLRYRKSAYFRNILTEMVAHFFGKFGRSSLVELLEEMGVTEAMVIHELGVFLVPLLDEAARGGFLEQQIRGALASFYRSPAAEAILRSRP